MLNNVVPLGPVDPTNKTADSVRSYYDQLNQHRFFIVMGIVETTLFLDHDDYFYQNYMWMMNQQPLTDHSYKLKKRIIELIEKEGKE